VATKTEGRESGTHEDLQALVDQVKATTQATEKIKAELTGQLWVSHERWKMKNDLYISLLSLLDTMAN
jgi:hypothetical protein